MFPTTPAIKDQFAKVRLITELMRTLAMTALRIARHAVLLMMGCRAFVSNVTTPLG